METLTSVAAVMAEVKNRMDRSEEALKKEFHTLRSGRASTTMVEGVMVDYYGAMTPLKQLGTISTPEPRQIMIQPWDASAVTSIVKAIQEAQLGFNPIPDGKVIRITVPELTNERRAEITKVARKYTEESRVSVRSARKDANEAIKRIEKAGTISEDASRKALDDIQKATDNHIKHMDELLKKKEDEINIV